MGTNKEIYAAVMARDIAERAKRGKSAAEHTARAIDANLIAVDLAEALRNIAAAHSSSQSPDANCLSTEAKAALEKAGL